MYGYRFTTFYIRMRMDLDAGHQVIRTESLLYARSLLRSARRTWCGGRTTPGAWPRWFTGGRTRTLTRRSSTFTMRTSTGTYIEHRTLQTVRFSWHFRFFGASEMLVSEWECYVCLWTSKARFCVVVSSVVDRHLMPFRIRIQLIILMPIRIRFLPQF
jgi:hypothetical protein